MKEMDFKIIDAILEKNGGRESSVIPVLQDLQREFKYLPPEALEYISAHSEISPARIAGVASFYTHFRHHPVGKHIVQVCHGTACHVKGAPLITDAIKRYLKIPVDGDTDKGNTFTVEKVACFGCCTLAPVVKIDGITYGRVTQQLVPEMITSFLGLSVKQKKKISKAKTGLDASGKMKPVEIRIGLGSCCVASGSKNVMDAVDDYILSSGGNAVTKRVGCVGICHHNPLVEVITSEGKSHYYTKVKPEDIEKIARKYITPGSLGRRLALGFKSFSNIFSLDEKIGKNIDSCEGEVNEFLAKQKRITLEYSGEIDPVDLAEYASHDGFKALETCLKRSDPVKVIEEIKASGLRGRGGAGFPTGEKWALVRSRQGKKYIICNGDEGDPGAFMDRMLLESYPYRVIEGLAIAAFATGAEEGVFYIREEYPLAVEHIKYALAECEKAGYLGKNIMQSGFNLKITVMQGAGAFVCGEESALMESIEGKRGNPRYRPPYPAEKGLFGFPTNINNVETYANVPWIIRNGAQKFAETGTGKSKGTKVFALAGNVNRGGLIEVPMGITVREVVEDIGGGVKEGRKFKAVQIGGPSGGCIPAEFSSTPVDYESLTEKGAIMGSGGLVVLDDTDCMVDVAKFFLDFTQDQSCGKCTFCRIGTKRMKEILEKLVNGEGKPEHLEELEKLAQLIKENSLCGLGKTAPNPVLSTLKYFREEYKAHVEKRCPAKKCKALINYAINDKCIGCTVCAQNCPADAIQPKPYEKHEIDGTKCIKCDTCLQVCKYEAVEKK
ncbi:MAG: NAD(P)H-dependent oxidoreductase subunit E [Candidatus Firestonebacteria bacterium]